MAQGNFFRTFRQLILLVALLFVATGSYLTKMRSTDWNEPLWITMYPINGDGLESTSAYIDKLETDTFIDIEKFMQRETQRYGVDIARPVRIDLGLPIEAQPPAPPTDGNPIKIALWSLKLRWWSRDITSDQPGARPDIRMFIVYHDPQARNSLPHSLGLQKGMIGVVHAFAHRRQRHLNNFVIAHEMLHTLGATDKYALNNNRPMFPHGYAEPGNEQRYPQRYAEIMGGRIPLTASKAVMPDGLLQALVGPATALEIRWIDSLEKMPVALDRADGQLASNN